MFLCVNAQKKITVKIYAFKTEQMPGTIMMNDKGEQVPPKPFAQYQLYTESNVKINWNKVWIDGSSYKVDATLIQQYPIEIGRSKTDKRNIALKQTPGFKLYKMALVQDDNNVSAPLNIAPALIIIKGKLQRKTILKTTNNVVELYTPPSV